MDNIEEVDYIWNGESYAELTGKRNHYDYVIASHVIEHTCDLVGFLRDCSDILKENGVLSLAIPDKRFCFDYLRPVTGISKVIDCHNNRCVVPTPGSVYEQFSNACKSGNDIAWEYPHPPVMMKPAHSVQESIERYKGFLNHNEYTDIHNWVFTMHSFELLIYDLNCLGLINMRIAASFETSEHEFLVTLVKMTEPFVADDEERFKLAVKAQLECAPLDPEDVFLKRQVAALEELAIKKEEHVKTLEEHIKGIYNSRSWKIANKLQKLYRLFVPHIKS
jgi:SAM-dependent methyltransferase